jgi:LDH2 family malate/lactate/ureidoglycolate dehydrogenase
MSTTPSHDPNLRLHVSQSSALSFAQSLLEANGVPSKNAIIVAKALVLADLRGVDTHGINRLPSYLLRLRRGLLNPLAGPTLHQITPVVAQVDGHNAFGFLSAQLGIEKGIEMAKTYGIGMVSVKHSNHFGMCSRLSTPI